MSVIRFFLVLAVIVFSVAVIAWSFYVKYKYDFPWGSYKGSHVSSWPGMLVLISIVGIFWALGDFWLHGGLKTRLKAKRQSDKDPAEQGQTEHAQTLAEDAGPEQAPTMQKPPTEP